MTHKFHTHPTGAYGKRVQNVNPLSQVTSIDISILRQQQKSETLTTKVNQMFGGQMSVTDIPDLPNLNPSLEDEHHSVTEPKVLIKEESNFYLKF